jgi:FdhD protein
MSCNAPLLPRTSPLIPASVIHALPEKQVDAQQVFSATGGLHATALFDAAGNLLSVCEDVGRHNAFDKAVGHAFLAATLPWSDKLVLLSGRASFELVQKAVMAGLPLLCAVGAPSSLAVETAEQFGMTLLGFVRDRRFNVYSAGWRIEAVEE